MTDQPSFFNDPRFLAIVNREAQSEDEAWQNCYQLLDLMGQAVADQKLLDQAVYATAYPQETSIIFTYYLRLVHQAHTSHIPPHRTQSWTQYVAETDQ